VPQVYFVGRHVIFQSQFSLSLHDSPLSFSEFTSERILNEAWELSHGIHTIVIPTLVKSDMLASIPSGKGEVDPQMEPFFNELDAQTSLVCQRWCRPGTS